MHYTQLAAHLAAIPSKRAFCKRHRLPTRTMWRLIGGKANPTQSTVDAFAAAIKADKRKASKATA